MRNRSVTEYDLAEAYIEQRLRNDGVKLVAEFVPQSKSRNRGEKSPTLNWLLTLTKHGTPIKIENIEYQQGIAHVPGYKHSYTAAEWNLRVGIQEAAEKGVYPTSKTACITRRLPAPSLVDVFSCLLLDGQGVEYGFESWCFERDYDPDSRKALALFELCGNIRGRLVAMFGEGVLNSYAEAINEAGL